jgi:thiamine biosynthesis lipoprotein
VTEGGFHHVEQVMGMPVTFDICAPIPSTDSVHHAIARLHQIDARFSTYKADSEVSRFGRGELNEPSDEFVMIERWCEDLRVESHGAFDARATAARPDGPPFDPSGIVKGWAVECASAILELGGARNYCINAGGDVKVGGWLAPNTPWRIGIRHPSLTHELAMTVEVHDSAVATSGSYERGDHVVDPRTGRGARTLSSVTVVGPSLTWADAYATVAYVMGLDGLEWVSAHDGYGAYAIRADGATYWTDEFDRVKAS